MARFFLRVALFLVGLVFAASLAIVLLLMAGVWALQYGWARLTGRPARAWVMRVDPRSGFNGYRAASGSPAAQAAAARARGRSDPMLDRLDPGEQQVSDAVIKRRSGAD